MSSQTRTEKVANFLDVAALVVASLAPLNLLLAIRLIGSCWCIFGLFLAATLLGLLGVARVLWRARDDNEFSPTLDKVDDVGVEATGYLASFVFPLIAVQSPTAQDLGAYAVFVFVYVVVLISTNLLAVNPLLYLFGLKIWRVESSQLQPGPRLLIGRRRPVVGVPYTMTRGSRMYVEHKTSKREMRSGS